MELLIFLVVGFIIFQTFAVSERQWKSVQEVETYLKKIENVRVDDVHKADVLGPEFGG